MPNHAIDVYANISDVGMDSIDVDAPVDSKHMFYVLRQNRQASIPIRTHIIDIGTHADDMGSWSVAHRPHMFSWCLAGCENEGVVGKRCQFINTLNSCGGPTSTFDSTLTFGSTLASTWGSRGCVSCGIEGSESRMASHLALRARWTQSRFSICSRLAAIISDISSETFSNSWATNACPRFRFCHSFARASCQTRWLQHRTDHGHMDLASAMLWVWGLLNVLGILAIWGFVVCWV